MKDFYDFGYKFSQPVDMDNDVYAGVHKRLDEVNEVFTSAAKAAMAAEVSTELTAQGKLKRRQELADETDRKLTELERSSAWTGYAENMKGVEDTIANKSQQDTSKESEIVTLLKQQEVRAHVRTLDPLELDLFYKAAVQAGNELVADAIEHSPLPFTFNEPDLVEKLREQRLMNRFPVEAAKLRDLRTAQRTLRNAMETARAVLREHQNLPLKRGVDSIAELAGMKSKAVA